MERPPEPNPVSNPVSQRLHGAFGPTYLTLMSVIQGVAMASLAGRVGDTASHLSLGDWILAANTFLVFVAIWNEYLVAALAYAWIPTFLDSLLPFILLTAELFMARFIAHDVRGWLLAMAGASFAAMVGLIHTVLRIQGADSSSREIYAALEGDQYLNIASTALGATVFLFAGLLYDVAGLRNVPFVVVIVATVIVAIYVSRSAAAWSRVHAYVAGTRKPPDAATTQHAQGRARVIQQMREALEPTFRRHARPGAGS